MRVILLLAVYAVLVSAAPQSGINSITKRTSEPEPEPIVELDDSERCGKSSPTRRKCPQGQTCVAEKEASDGKGGICVEKPKPCGDEFSCSQSDGACVSDPRVKCPAGVDCDGGICLWAPTLKAMGGQKQLNLKPVVCGGSTGVKCANGQLCVGELGFARGTGVCTKWHRYCGYFNGPTCPDGTLCVPNPQIECPKGAMDCVMNGICVRGDWVKTYGGGMRKPTKPDPTLPRCNISGFYQCPENHLCAAVQEIGDGKGGVCIPKPVNNCSNAGGRPCATKGDVCVGNLKMSCPVGIDCGSGVCVPQKLAKTLKLKQPEPRPLGCDIYSGRKGCTDKATCVGGFPDFIGLCIKDPIKCSLFEDRDPPCPDDADYYCVPGCRASDQSCSRTGVCVRQDWARKYGGQKAAPEPRRKPSKTTVPSKRCRGSTGNECDEGEVCLGEREFDDGIGGVCVQKPGRCANFLGERCAAGDYCVEDPDEDCPPDVQDCGSNLCLPASIVEELGVTVRKYPFRCGGDSGKQCRDNLFELCVGEKESEDGKGVCINHPMSCGIGSGGKKCSDESYYYCAPDPRSKCNAKQKNCAGICIPAKTADLYGMRSSGVGY
ncbi:hypothetical protein ABW20_dc0109419 [Dactylellina cionopaga]|nr:hypothetical protein ABW20_dc0109419 [Dactylellina cionopaga]